LEAALNVLLVGSGGREHAIAWKLAQSDHLNKLWVAPGNPGTANLGQNIPIGVEDVAALVAFSRENQVNLVVIGPEVALAAGLADAMAEAGISVFGPSRAAAQIETSKSFAKKFMLRHAIPTSRFAVFNLLEDALQHLEKVDYPVVIKASGLAAGKGVILPASKEEAMTALQEMLLEHRFGKAGDEVVIEERLEGEEVSVLAFCDGYTLSLMPPAQDHKRLLDNDQGPNTGGMGANAPAPVCPPRLQQEILHRVLQPAVDGLRAEGLPFVGVLYAGVMLSKTGLQVLEFNARFGDPETQAILPLLSSDLLEILSACTRGELTNTPVHWQPGAAVCVVMASAGYPEKPAVPAPISGLDLLPSGCQVFHAGTSMKDGQLLASGGRVLGITAAAGKLTQAVEVAYQAVHAIHFDGAQFRHDIATRALCQAISAYASAGVSIDSGNLAVNLMSAAVKSTYNSRVLAGIGAFGGLYDGSELVAMRSPVLVASTDGVGTKVKLAASLGRCRGVGIDIVNHCVNDILVQGARPLFFLDYFATAKLDPHRVAEVVDGIAEACRDAGCVLLGGETAEMPGVYLEGEFDLAGTIIGYLERDRMLPRPDIHPGDLLIGLRSNGAHTNGYSLLRQIFEDTDLLTRLPGTEGSLAEALLAPHRSYLNLLLPLIENPESPILGLAHLTGGGFVENIPRILPKELGAHIQTGSWPVPPLFHLAQSRGAVENAEMYRVFNMGIGMLAVVHPQDAPAVQSALPEQTWIIGTVVEDTQHRVKLI
jgi:phosphoribosylamine--glycine ligase/phosphoribosylformylglycinamidine cyclo-ligase